MRPFLTVVTRCCRRPLMLSRNIESVLAQSDCDVEQVFVVDRERQGVPWANRSLAQAADRVTGEYVYILDDDTVFIEPKFVRRLKQFTRTRQGEVVMVRSLRLQMTPWHLPTVWLDPGVLRIGTTNALCYVVQRDAWAQCIAAFGAPAAGDWHFLAALRSAGCAIDWLDLTVAKTQQLGRGVHFEDCKADWFEQVARKFRIAGPDGGFRLPAYLNQRQPAPAGRRRRTARPQPTAEPTAPEPQHAPVPPVHAAEPRPPAPHVLLSRRQRKV